LQIRAVTSAAAVSMLSFIVSNYAQRYTRLIGESGRSSFVARIA
jgi:hypothetical protein